MTWLEALDTLCYWCSVPAWDDNEHLQDMVLDSLSGYSGRAAVEGWF